MSGPSRFGRPLGSAFVLAFGFVLALGASPIVAAGAAPDHTTRVRVAPRIGPPGTVLTVRGEGFSPGEAVDVYLDGTDRALGVADGRGRFRGVEVQVPETKGAGDHWVTLVGRRSGRTAQARFEVGSSALAAWPQPGHDPGHTNVNRAEDVLGPQNLSHLGTDWLTHPPAREVWGAEFGAFAVAHGVAYATSDEGRLIAVRVSDGAILWWRVVPGTAHMWFGSSTPTVGEDLVFVQALERKRRWDFSGRRLLYAFDRADGSVAWSRVIDCPDCGEQHWASRPLSPTLRGDTLFVSTSPSVSEFEAVREAERLCAVGAFTGVVRWCRTIESPSAPAVAGDTVVVTSNRWGGGVTALDAATGAVRWTYELGENRFEEATVAGGAVYAAARQRLYSFDLADGTVRWSAKLPGAPSRSVAVADGTVYATATREDEARCFEGCPPLDGAAFAFDADTGDLAWRRSFGPTWVGPPTVANGVVYTTGVGMVALDAERGRVLTTVGRGEWWQETVVVAEGRVFLTGYTLRALSNTRDLPRVDPRRLVPDPALRPGPTHEVSRMTVGWEEVVAAGLGRDANVAVASSVELDGALHLGTEIRPGARTGAEVWRTTDGVVFDRVHRFGASNTAVELAAFGGGIVAVTENADGFRVWRAANGAAFERVGMGGIERGARATPVAFGGRLLLAVDDPERGASVLVSEDAVTFEMATLDGPIAKVGRGFADEGFGVRPGFPGTHGVVFAGELYLGTTGRSAGVWRTSDGLTFERIRGFEGARAATPQAVWGGWLYTTVVGRGRLEVWRSGDGVLWQEVMAMPTVRGRNLDGSIAALDGALLLVTRNRPERALVDGQPIETGLTRSFEVWRSTDGTRWSEATPEAFGDPHDYAGTTLAVGGVGYVAVSNDREGDAVWSTSDGLHWEQLFRAAAPAPGDVHLLAFGDHLYVLGTDLGEGLSVWRRSEPLQAAQAGEPQGGVPLWLWALAALVVGGMVGWLAHRPRTPGGRPAPRAA